MTIPKTCMPGRLLVVWGLSATTALTELTEHGNMVVSCGAANLQQCSRNVMPKISRLSANTIAEKKYEQRRKTYYEN